MRLCINCGWSCGLITATSGSRASKSVRWSVASRITAFTTLKIFVATSDVALLPFEKAILNFSTVEQNETESETFLWHGNWIRHAFDVQKKNQEQTVIDLRWLVNFLPVVQQYPWPPCGKSQICGFSLLLIRTTAGHWMLGTHWMPGLQGSHFLKKFGLTNQKRWNKIWNGPMSRRKVSRI